MSHNLERDWTTRAGLRAVCLLVHNSHRCGYVAVPPGHPLHGQDYDKPDVSCHGGLTYASSGDNYPVRGEGNDLWWFGFDCHHLGDASLDPRLDAFHERGATVKSQRYVENECERLAEQLALVTTEGGAP